MHQKQRKVKPDVPENTKASLAIREFFKEKKYEDYTADLMLSSAVERQFEILGESLKRIREKG